MPAAEFVRERTL